eukprot:GHVL01003160.1.p1 GENE.GHVL01003160.1~~GHVL01003160.1.p1  ORF type:complete len:2347 (-),score=554.57 GHVL01003160.1:550-7590(-)
MNNDTSTDWTQEFLTWPALYGGPCPAGAYCLHKAENPIACPAGYSSFTEGGKDATSCTRTPAGYYRLDHMLVPEECPRGYYCPVGAFVPLSCPIATHRNETLGIQRGDCDKCPPGFFCGEEGIGVYEVWACPTGHYCPSEGTIIPIPCAAGTYQNVTGAGSPDNESCLPCPESFFCEKGSSGLDACPPGSYCPEGSDDPIDCTPGGFCSGSNIIPEDCPLGFYCPLKSIYPTICARGGYCPGGSAEPLLCPNGYQSDPHCIVNFGRIGCCSPCKAGTYAVNPPDWSTLLELGKELEKEMGSQIDLYDSFLTCKPCPAGYVCTGGTSSIKPQSEELDGGYPCHPGFYCPEGSLWESACPPGTFNSEFGLTSINLCSDCLAGTYNDMSGRPGCLVCGTTSFSQAGSVSCECMGKFRAFQPQDATCVCQPGYEAYDLNFNPIWEEDSIIDCQPVVRDRCSNEEYREAGGRCTDPTDCAAACDGGPGKFMFSLGLCQCQKIVNPLIVCDEACRAKQIKATVSANGLVINDPATGETTNLDHLRSDGSLFGSLSCDPSLSTTASEGMYDCPIEFQQVSKTGFDGYFGMPRDLLDETGRRLNADHGRNLQQVAAPSIRNPVLCVPLGASVVWRISDGRYPVYVKDSLLNSNKDFDTSSFRSLATQMEKGEGAETIMLFAYTFTKQGVHVFATNADPSLQTVISVMPNSERCAESAMYPMPLTTASLSIAGVKRSTDLNLKPDWLLIALFICGIIIIGLLVLLLMSWIRKRAWIKLQKMGGLGNVLFISLGHFGIKGRAANQGGDIIKQAMENSNVGGAEIDRLKQLEDERKNQQVLCISDEEMRRKLNEMFRGKVVLDPRLFVGAYRMLLEYQNMLETEYINGYKQRQNDADEITEAGRRLKDDLLARLAMGLEELNKKNDKMSNDKDSLENFNNFASEEMTDILSLKLNAFDNNESNESRSTSEGDSDDEDYSALLEEKLMRHNAGSLLFIGEDLDELIMLHPTKTKLFSKSEEEGGENLKKQQSITNEMRRCEDAHDKREEANNNKKQVRAEQDKIMKHIVEKHLRENVENEAVDAQESLLLDAELSAKSESATKEAMDELKEKLKSANTDEERAALLEEFNKKMELLAHNEQQEKEAAQLELKERIKQRRMDRLAKQNNEISQNMNDQKIALEACNNELAAANAEELKANHDRQLIRIEELIDEQNEKEINQNESISLAKMALFEQQQKQILKDKLADIDTDDEEGRQALIKEFQQQLNSYQEQLDEEQDSQLLSLKQRQEARRENRLNILLDRQAAENDLLKVQQEEDTKSAQRWHEYVAARASKETEMDAELATLKLDHDTRLNAAIIEKQQEMNEQMRLLALREVIARANNDEDELNAIFGEKQALIERIEQEKNNIISELQQELKDSQNAVKAEAQVELQSLQMEYQTEGENLVAEKEARMLDLQAILKQKVEIELNTKYNDEEEALKRISDADAQVEEAALDRSAAETKDKMLEEENEKMRKELDSSVSEDERKSIIEEYEGRRKRLELVLDDDYASQKEVLKERLAKRLQDRLDAAGVKRESELKALELRAEQAEEHETSKNAALTEIDQLQEELHKEWREEREKQFEEGANEIQNQSLLAREKFQKQLQTASNEDDFEKQKQILLDDWKHSMGKQAEEIQLNMLTQQNDLQRRLEERRRRLIEYQANNKMNEKVPEVVEEGMDESDNINISRPSLYESEMKMNELVKLASRPIIKEEHEKLRAQQISDMNTVKNEIDNEINLIEKSLQEESREIEKDQVKIKLKAEADFRMRFNLTNTEEEKKKLIKEHQDAIYLIEKTIEDEKIQQRDEIQKMLKIRKNNVKFREKLLEQKQENERIDQDLALKKQALDMQHELAKMVEDGMLKSDDDPNTMATNLRNALLSRFKQEQHDRQALNVQERAAKLCAHVGFADANKAAAIAEKENFWIAKIDDARAKKKSAEEIDTIRKERIKDVQKIGRVKEIESKNSLDQLKQLLSISHERDLILLRKKQQELLINKMQLMVNSGSKSAYKWVEEGMIDLKKIEVIIKDQENIRRKAIERECHLMKIKANLEIEKQQKELEARFKEQQMKAKKIAKERMLILKNEVKKKMREGDKNGLMQQHTKHIEKLQLSLEAERERQHYFITKDEATKRSRRRAAKLQDSLKSTQIIQNNNRSDNISMACSLKENESNVDKLMTKFRTAVRAQLVVQTLQFNSKGLLNDTLYTKKNLKKRSILQKLKNIKLILESFVFEMIKDIPNNKKLSESPRPIHKIIGPGGVPIRVIDLPPSTGNTPVATPYGSNNYENTADVTQALKRRLSLVASKKKSSKRVVIRAASTHYF